MSQRPDIQHIHSAAVFRNWYWLKAELIAYCKKLGIPYSGNKAALIERIATVLETGDVRNAPLSRARQIQSDVNWTTATLSLDTIITDSYKNNRNMRTFMQTHADPKFKFYIDFMQWMKDNIGKTLRDAVEAHHAFMLRRQDPHFKSTIPASNQYNRYLRDFFADNPQRSIAEARACWQWKRSQPAPHQYAASDLAVISPNDNQKKSQK